VVPASLKIPMPFEFAFPHGALFRGVQAATDFDKRGKAVDDQLRDKETGERVWTVTLLDLDPLAARFGRDLVKVKIIAPVQPVPPESTVPGYPPAVELTDLVLVPWVDDSKCKAGGTCRARLAYSMRASGLRPAGLSALSPAV
jgi:hypothetical protein